MHSHSLLFLWVFSLPIHALPQVAPPPPEVSSLSSTEVPSALEPTDFPQPPPVISAASSVELSSGSSPDASTVGVVPSDLPPPPPGVSDSPMSEILSSLSATASSIATTQTTSTSSSQIPSASSLAVSFISSGSVSLILPLPTSAQSSLLLSTTTSTTSSITALPSSPPPPTTDGRCGPGHGGTTCAGFVFGGTCCSRWGWCGASNEYCGSGCQAGFGTCSGSVEDGGVGRPSSALSSVPDVSSAVSPEIPLASSSSSSAWTSSSCTSSDWSASSSANSSITSATGTSSTFATSISASATSAFSVSSNASSSATSSNTLSASSTPAPTYYFRTSTQDGNQALNGLYLYAARRSAFSYDAVFQLTRDPLQAGTLVNTELRWLFPSNTSQTYALDLAYQDTVDWQEVRISGTHATTGFVIVEGFGLFNWAQAAWRDWLVCYWNRGGQPQLFWLTKSQENTQVPSSCSVVTLVPVLKTD